MKRASSAVCLSFVLLINCLVTGCGGGSQSTPPPNQNPVPTLSSVSPNSATAGGAALTITATGSGFIATSAVEWNGAALTTTLVSGTSVTAQVPATDLATAGTANLTVVNPAPGGGTSAAVTFTINQQPNPAPTISSISPDNAVMGGAAFTLTVAGTGFVATSQVEWNASAVTTAYVSDTSLTAQIPASDLATAGTASVTVVNPTPGGGTSSAASFTISAPNPAPTVTSMSPAAAVAGALPFTLAVTGTDFVATSQVLWNNDALPTTFGSSTSLTAQVPASDLASAGTASVSVVTPAPGGGTSSTLTFTINLTSATLQVLNVAGNDLTWDATHGKLYVAVPSGVSTNPSTITVVDPVAGAVGASQSLSSAAYGVAISDDDSYLYAAINGGATIQRLTLPNLTPDIQWTLGTNPSNGDQYLTGDMKVQPGAPHTVALLYGDYGNGLAGVFDDGVERTSVASPDGSTLLWKADGSELYAGYGTGSDCGYWESTSDVSLTTLPVTASGVTTAAVYNSVFTVGEGVHLHADPTTGYIYDDVGDVVNPVNGEPVGAYSYSGWISGFFPGSLEVVDPAAERVFVLEEITETGGSLAYQIQSFDQDTFRPLSTVVIPNASGTITNFIPWGQSGLAFVTAPSGTTSGQLYILDGTFVNPSGVQDTTAGSAVTPVPTLSSMSPLTATAGSGDTLLTITGRDFLGTPTVYWNGSALPTTAVNTTEVQATIPSADLATATQATITVANGASAVPGSGATYFGVDPAPPAGTQITVYPTGGNDLKWDANAAKLYVSVPGIQGTQGDSVAVVDPVAGTVSPTAFLGSEPDQLAVSSDGSYLYVGLDGQNAIEQLTLPGFEVNNAWNLSADSFFGPYYALDIEAAPAAPQTTAVILGNFNISPSAASVQIYDDSTARGSGLQVLQYPYGSLQWAGDDSTLYAVDQQEAQDFLVLGVGSAGATLSQHYDGILSGYSPTLHYDAGTGMVYTDAGQVVNPANGTVVASFGASGIAVPDSTLDRVYILGQTTAQTGTQNYTIESFDQTSFAAVGSIAISNVVGTPTALVRWGSNGLAFTTLVQTPPEPFAVGPGQLYVVSGSFVTAAARPGTNGGAAAAIAPVRRTWPTAGSNRQRAGTVTTTQ